MREPSEPSEPAATSPLAGKLHARPGLPVLPPRNAVIELVLFFVVVMGLQWGLQSFPDLNEFEPHPFWLPVLLLSLQYGTVSGLLAAGTAIVLTAIMGWPEQDIGENHFNYLIRIWTQPVLWIGAAMLLGQFRMRQISEHRELHRLADELYKQRAAIADHSVHLRQRCEMLERKIAGAPAATALRLLDAFSSLAKHDPELIRTRFGDCMEAAFGAGQYSLFVLQNHELSLVCSSGWEDRYDWRDQFCSDDPLFRALVGARDGLTILRARDEAALLGQGLAAIAVRSGSGERMLGMLKVEFMAPGRFDKDLLKRLEVIAARLAPSLELQTISDGAVIEPQGMAAGRNRKSRWRQVRRRSGSQSKKPDDKPAGVLKKPKIIR